MNAICQDDNATLVLEIMTDAMTESHQAPLDPRDVDWDLIIDDMGHTPLHLAASLARIDTVKALVGAGADIHRGNYQGETPLIRAILSTHNFDDQSFESLLLHLHPSIRTIDTAKRSVLHHATLTAGVRNRAVYAKYYMDTVLSWIAKNEGGDFRNLVDLQDEHGDTALNVAARVGNRSLVKSLLEIGANRTLANKLGLRPGDFGVVPEVSNIF
jgi:ankyrin repeat protein